MGMKFISLLVLSLFILAGLAVMVPTNNVMAEPVFNDFSGWNIITGAGGEIGQKVLSGSDMYIYNDNIHHGTNSPIYYNPDYPDGHDYTTDGATLERSVSMPADASYKLHIIVTLFNNITALDIATVDTSIGGYGGVGPELIIGTPVWENPGGQLYQVDYYYNEISPFMYSFNGWAGQTMEYWLNASMYSGWTLWSHEVGYGGSGLITTNFPSHNSLHPFDKITITTETDNGSNPSAQPGLIFHTIAFFDSTVAPPSTYTDGRLGHWSPVILSYGNVFQTIFVNVNYGKEELTQPINGTFAKFYPGITGVRTLAFYLNVYDNDTLIYRSENPHTYNSDGNPAHGVWYNETFTVNGQVFTINPQPGHTYYYLFMVYILDPATLQTVGASEFPLVITDKPVQSNQMGWIIGLIWIMILFTMPWLVNWFFPRYGFMLGMVMMAILLGITESGFLMVTLVIVITVAVMAFVIQRGN